MCESEIKSCNIGSRCHVIRDLNRIVGLLKVERRDIVSGEGEEKGDRVRRSQGQEEPGQGS